MKLILHPDAVKNFNDKVESLKLELSLIPDDHLASKDTFKPDRPISAVIAEEDAFKNARYSLVDGIGVETAKYFPIEGKCIGLQGDSLKKLVKIAQEMQKIKELFARVSVDLLSDFIFDWIKDRYANTTNLSMVDYVLKKVEESIQEFEIWIPIAMLSIESEIQIGKVLLRPLNKEIFDKWRTKIENDPVDKEKNLILLEKERKELQGFTVAIMKISAEPKRMAEIAFEEAEKSISLLRFFSPANLVPEIVSYCMVFGKGNVETTKYFLIQEDMLVYTNQSSVKKALPFWVVNNADISKFKVGGLETLSKLLSEDNKTEFKGKLLDSLLWYSKSSLAKNMADKLVYILVALESILLKNEDESIQQNISERIAFFIGRNLNERKSIIKNFKRIYSLRSSFLHHGREIEDLETLKEFMFNAWRFFDVLILNIDRFDTKEQFLEKIEEIKLS